MCRQEPNSAWGATIRSPVFNWLIRAANTAAMPLAVAKQRSAPRKAASRSSNMETVGLRKRE